MPSFQEQSIQAAAAPEEQPSEDILRVHTKQLASILGLEINKRIRASNLGRISLGDLKAQLAGGKGRANGGSPTNIRMSDLRAKMDAEVGRMMRDGNVKVKQSQINAMLKREVVDMMRLRFGSEVTSLLSGSNLGRFVQSKSKFSKTSGSGSATQVNF